MKLGVSLAGGGVKGAAHIGALKALEEKNIPVDYLSGTSSGSIVTTLYGAGYSCNEILNIFHEYSKKIKYIDFKNIFNIAKRLVCERKFRVDGFNTGEIIENLINKLCNAKNIYNIKDIKQDILIVSVSLNSGKVYFFESNPKESRYSDGIIHINDINIGKAVRASSSFPAVFCPCKYKKFRFLDGGVLDNIPVAEVKKQGADKVIAVNFKADDITEESNIMDIVMRTIDIMGNKISEEGLSSSDYVLTVETDKTGLLDFEKLDKCYKYGYQAAIKEMDKIKEIVTKR